MVVSAQSSVLPVLERKVTITANNRKAQDVLRELEQQAGCTFSYPTSLIPVDKTVSVSVSNRSVRETIDKMFQGKIIGKDRGQHIILSKAPENPKVISGYVENANGERVSGASVYDAGSMTASTTNEFGYYEMKIKREKPVSLSVSKKSFNDTLVPVDTNGSVLQNIVIEEEKKDTTLQFVLSVMKDTKDSLVASIVDASHWAREKLLWNQNSRNIRDTLNRPFQFSLVPFVGTNGRLSGSVVNDWSVNLIGGYNRGVRKGEFAGMFNVNREDVSFMQFAGFSNMVGGSMSGIQMSGFSNINVGNTTGAQFSGFSNLNMGQTSGAQFSGFSNISLGNVNGIQAAGFSNITTDSIRGAQIAGFINIASGVVKGAQISGFMNVAKHVKGAQIGVFNVADSIKGIPIGLISYVHHGYHKLEFAYDELSYGHLSFRTGVNHFYNILTVGAFTGQQSDTVDWQFGYGLGCSPKISDRVMMNIDITGNQIVHGNIEGGWNHLAKLNFGVDVGLTKWFSVFAGVTANGLFSGSGADRMRGMEGRHIVYSDRINDNVNVQSWLGWRVGIRLF